MGSQANTKARRNMPWPDTRLSFRTIADLLQSCKPLTIIRRFGSVFKMKTNLGKVHYILQINVWAMRKIKQYIMYLFSLIIVTSSVAHVTDIYICLRWLVYFLLFATLCTDAQQRKLLAAPLTICKWHSGFSLPCLCKKDKRLPRLKESTARPRKAALTKTACRDGLGGWIPGCFFSFQFFFLKSEIQEVLICFKELAGIHELQNDPKAYMNNDGGENFVLVSFGRNRFFFPLYSCTYLRLTWCDRRVFWGV